MRTLPHPLSVVLLALLLGTLFGCISPLTSAARRGDTETVRTLLDQGATADMNHAFILAACSGHGEVVQLFLERGAGVNEVDQSLVTKGYSALHCAAANGHAPVVSLLLQHGADRENKGPYGKTALELAKEEGHASVVKILEDAPAVPAASPPQRSRPAPSAAESPPPPIY